MSLANDIADDWAFIDEVEEVTFTRRTPDTAPIPSVKALRGNPTRKEIAFGQQLGISPHDVSFVLWVSPALTGVEVNPYDLITQTDGSVWQVISASLLTLDTRWRCICRKQES